MVRACHWRGAAGAALLGAVFWVAAGCGAAGTPSTSAPAKPAATAAPAGGPAASAPAPPASTGGTPGTAVATSATGAAAPGPLAVPLKVRMGSNDSVVNGPIYIALDRHYFTDVGLEVEDIRFGAASQMMQPLAAGQLDVVPSAISAGLFNALARDIDVRLVAGRETAKRGFGIFGVVARQDLWDSGAIRTLGDLRGRKVAIAGANAGSTLQMALARGLERQGMSLADLDVVDIPYPDTNAAWRTARSTLPCSLSRCCRRGRRTAPSAYWRAPTTYILTSKQASSCIPPTSPATTQIAGRRWMVAYLGVCATLWMPSPATATAMTWSAS